METLADKRGKQTWSAVTFDHDLPPGRKQKLFNDVSTCVPADVRVKNKFHIISILTRTAWSPVRDHPHCHLLSQDNEILSRYDKNASKSENSKWMHVLCFCNPFSGYIGWTQELQRAAYNESVAAFFFCLPLLRWRVGVKGCRQNKMGGTKQWEKLRELAELLTIPQKFGAISDSVHIRCWGSDSVKDRQFINPALMAKISKTSRAFHSNVTSYD